MVVRKSKKEEAERRRREQQRIFVEGLQRYKSKGIQILIDGRECRPEEYRKLCEFREDGSFYMADYVGAETGVLTEIHFDRFTTGDKRGAVLSVSGQSAGFFFRRKW